MAGSAEAESYLTVAEVAELLKLNQQTVRNWIDQGSLPAHRIGRRVRIKRSDLDRVLEEGSTTTGHRTGPSGADFWGGKPVGAADLDPDTEPPDHPADTNGHDPDPLGRDPDSHGRDPDSHGPERNAGGPEAD